MTVVVVIAGPVVDQVVPDDIELDVAWVVAADGGADLALGLGLHIDQVVGDLDSISEAARRAVDQARIPVEAHPQDKDLTDFELALRVALDHRPEPEGPPGRVVVLGGGGGRLDHQIANLAALAGAARSTEATTIEAWFGTAHVFAVADRAVLEVEVGSVVSVLPWGGPVRVTTTGLRWMLRDEWLAPDAARGVSNRADRPRVEVNVHEGLALVVIPGASDRDRGDSS